MQEEEVPAGSQKTLYSFFFRLQLATERLPETDSIS